MALVEIEFKGRRKGIFDNPQEFPLRRSDPVIVRADRGEDIGRVSLVGSEWAERLASVELEEECQPVLRLANGEDHEREKENRGLEKDAHDFFLEEVKRENLEMKLVDVEYQLDRRKLTFYFTADGRVDFRELVKVLAQHFHTRIDLRQIGARDEAKRLGGIGLCGRELCCATWIREFKPVTTSMLKEQNLLLNPQKNTGLCGKLRCCLRYEVDQYREINRLFPKADTKVTGPRGQGTVEKISMCHSSLGISWSDGHKIGYTFDQIRQFTNWDPERRDEIKVIEFSEDPSIIIQEKEEREGHLITSYDPDEEEKQKKGSRNNSRGRGKKRSSHSGKRNSRRSTEAKGNGSKREGGEIVEMREAVKSGGPDEENGGSKRRRNRRGRSRGKKPNGENGSTPNNANAKQAQGEGKKPKRNRPPRNRKPGNRDNQGQTPERKGVATESGTKPSNNPSAKNNNDNRQDRPRRPGGRRRKR